MTNYNLTNIDRVIDDADRHTCSIVVDRIQDELLSKVEKKVMEEVNEQYVEEMGIKEIDRIKAKVMLDMMDTIDEYENDIKGEL